MIHAGDTIHNPITGERIVFHQTAADTGGEAVVIETFVDPGGFVAAAHVHPAQEERFQVLRGSVGFQLGRRREIAGPGERVTVPAGRRHRFWNAGDGVAQFVCEIRPALQFESLLETMFALAGDGKTNRKGMPNPLRLAVIANAHFDTVRLPFPPAALQKLALALGAPLGRLLGYRAVYTPAGGEGTRWPHDHAPQAALPHRLRARPARSRRRRRSRRRLHTQRRDDMNPLKQRPLLLPAVLAVGLWIAGLVVENRFSDKIPHHPTDAQLLSWIQGNTSSILFGGWLWMLGCLSFLWFAALLRARLAAAEGETTTYSMLAFAGAVAATVFGMLVVAGDIGAAINKDSISAATAGVLHNGGDMFFIGAELTMILFFLGSAVVALRTNALPKWLAVLAILVAVVLVIGPIGWAALIFATPLWLLLTGAVVGRTDRVRRISPTVVTAAIALVALVGVVVPSAVAAPQPRSLTFHLLEKSLTFSYQDNPPYGAPFRKASPGDAFEFSSALLTRDGKRAGTIRAHCVFITGGAGNSAASICDGTFGFAGGTLEAQTTQRGDSAVTRIAIIGGTGAYEGATGSVTSVSSNNGPTRDTFHIVLP